jgi:UDP-N-acetylmuramate dehydrogenase
MKAIKNSLPISDLRVMFGDQLQENVHLSNYTTARVGGIADGMLIVYSSKQLLETVQKLWDMDIPVLILGSGANILISDMGYRGMVIINRARTIKIDDHLEKPSAWAESGANFASIARQAALRGLSGLEWASTIPGTVGGAVYGNAGAHGLDMSRSLVMAEILHRKQGKVDWDATDFAYGYRTSALKQTKEDAVILSVRMALDHGTKEAIEQRMSEYSDRRRSTQPSGASMGSTFKNPTGDYAGRLIEACGLMGERIGGVEISTQHANFFINRDNASAMDYCKLIEKARKRVREKFDVELELEIEKVGEWPEDNSLGQ